MKMFVGDDPRHVPMRSSPAGITQWADCGLIQSTYKFTGLLAAGDAIIPFTREPAGREFAGELRI